MVSTSRTRTPQTAPATVPAFLEEDSADSAALGLIVMAVLLLLLRLVLVLVLSGVGSALVGSLAVPSDFASAALFSAVSGWLGESVGAGAGAGVDVDAGAGAGGVGGLVVVVVLLLPHACNVAS